MLEPLDQESALVVRARVHRPAHRLATTRREPLLRRGEERVRHGLIVDALEETPEADAVVVKAVVCPILDRGDPADDFAVALGEKERAGGTRCAGR